IHRRDAFRGEEALAARVTALPNVKLQLNATVAALKGDSVLTGLTLNTPDGQTDIDVQGLFVCIGQKPENEAFADLVQLDEAGYIVAAEDCRTSCEGVFTAGDCRTKAIRQLTTAAADGTVAALAACTYIAERG
ncbi:MAG: FAD-dependent oxidoreductase, partial [Oscillospiraceae bacterium]|nr:FAD-dependent oxidoreductase [Oscillospiraceae bacterium]